MRMMKKLLRMKPHQMIMIPETLWLTAWYRFRILYRPFSELSAQIGEIGKETPMSDEAPYVAGEIRWALAAVSKRVPWTCNCMVRALTAKNMLHRRGYDATLYMGVAPAENGTMEAHAWLRCGSRIITGKANMERYTVTTIYGARKK